MVLRFSIDKKLTEAYGTRNWYDCSGLNQNAIGQISYAKEKIASKLGIDKDDITNTLIHSLLSELSFGFWTKLFGTGNKNNSILGPYDYEETLWRKGKLHSLFPKEIDRVKIYQLISELNEFRNLIAHHEPIFYRNLEQDYQNILTLLGWLSPEMRDYTISTTRIPYLLENRGTIKSLNYMERYTKELAIVEILDKNIQYHNKSGLSKEFRVKSVNTSNPLQVTIDGYYVEILVGYRYATKYEALAAIKSLCLSICNEEEKDIESRNPKLFHFEFGLIPIQNFKEPKYWGIICINERYSDKLREKITNDWP